MVEPGDLRLVVPPREPDDLFVAQLSQRAASATEAAERPRGARWQIAAAGLATAAVVVGASVVAALAGGGVGTEPAPAEQPSATTSPTSPTSGTSSTPPSPMPPPPPPTGGPAGPGGPGGPGTDGPAGPPPGGQP